MLIFLFKIEFVKLNFHSYVIFSKKNGNKKTTASFSINWYQFPFSNSPDLEIKMSL